MTGNRPPVADSSQTIFSDAQEILDHSPIGFFTSTPEGRLIFVNQALTRLFGYGSPEELMRSVSDIARQIYSVPEDRKDFIRQLEEHGEVVNFECRFCRRDGTTLWVSTNARLIRDGEGNGKYYQGFITDITDLKQAEATLRENTEHLTATLRSIGAGVIVCNERGAVVSLNPLAERLTGWTADEAMGRHLKEVFHIVHAQTNAILECPVERTLREGVVVELPYHAKLIARTNDERMIADSCAPICSEAGKIIGAVLVFRDVTEEYRHRMELVQIRNAVEEASDAIGICTADGQHYYQNKAFTRLFGYELEEFQNVPISEVYADTSVTQKVFSTIKQGDNVDQDIEMIDRNGRRFQVNLRANAVHDREGRIIGLVGIHSDITERNRAEREIRRLNRNIIEVQERERQRVARDLHDGVGQTLMAAKLQLTDYINDPNHPGWRFAKGLEFIDLASSELREIYMNLFPSMLDDLGLAATLRWYLNNHPGLQGVSAELALPDLLELPHDIEVAVYRILQEAISNIAKHSGASSVAISMDVCSEEVVIDIIDNGKGFDPLVIRETPGFGIMNMKHRTLRSYP